MRRPGSRCDPQRPHYVNAKCRPTQARLSEVSTRLAMHTLLAAAERLRPQCVHAGLTDRTVVHRASKPQGAARLCP